MNAEQETVSATRRRRLCGAALAGALLLTAAAAAFRPLHRRQLVLPTWEVAFADLPVRMSQRGILEPQVSTPIDCDVYSFGLDSGSTCLLHLAPHGSYVREGQLLLELDSPLARERLERYADLIPYYEARQIQARVLLENQKTLNETLLARARLNLRLAELALECYGDEQGGSYEILLQDFRMRTQAALAEYGMWSDRERATRALYQLGYRTKLDQSLAGLKTLTAQSKLNRAVLGRSRLEQHDRPRAVLQLQHALLKAQHNLRRVEVDNRARLIAREAVKFEADLRIDRYKELVERYAQQVRNFKVYAPHDGYAIWEADRYGRMTVGEGCLVRWGQTIMRIVQTSRMQVDAPLHELEAQQVRPGMRAEVCAVAGGGRRHHGIIQEVDFLPDQLSSNPDINVYHAIVRIDEQVEGLHPGMTCVVDIDLDTRQHVLCAPVEALVCENGRYWAYVVGEGGVQRRAVTIGASNDRLVEICDGLAPGDRVSLEPSRLREQAGAEPIPF